MPTRSKKVRSFDVPINDLSLHVAGSPELYEEVRAAGMSFFERVQSYGVRNKAFASSKRPLHLPDDAPQIAIDMARDAAAAGVGPMYTFRGALVEFVGRTLAAHEHRAYACPEPHRNLR